MLTLFLLNGKIYDSVVVSMFIFGRVRLLWKNFHFNLDEMSGKQIFSYCYGPIPGEVLLVVSSYYRGDVRGIDLSAVVTSNVSIKTKFKDNNSESLFLSLTGSIFLSHTPNH